MPLVSMNDMLKAAQEGHYAVGAFNVVSLESLQAIITAATQLRAPVILNVAEVHFQYFNLDLLAPAIISAAKQAAVPVALHLDHGLSMATASRCLRLGFTSLMFDGSMLPYNDNVAITAQVVQMAHNAGVTVEAELGHVAGGENSDVPKEADTSRFTNPEQAVDFVKKTGVDALAVAVGSVHGLYKGEPKLDYNRLQSIAQCTGVPLVLHGGSGIPDADIRKAISLGIAKINVYTEMAIDATQQIRTTLQNPNFISYPELLMQARQVMQNKVAEKIRLFGCAGVCSTHPTN